MTCPSCEAARADPYSPFSHGNCPGCNARALSRSVDYAQSKATGHLTKRYRNALKYVDPDPAKAHSMVKEWAKETAK